MSDGECISKNVDQLTENLYSFSLVSKSKRDISKHLQKCFDLRSTYMKSQAASPPKPYPGKKMVKTHQWYEENKCKMLDCVDERKVPKKEVAFLEDQKKGNNPNQDKELKRNMFSAGIESIL